MKQYAGLVVGVIWYLMAFGAFGRGMEGWSQGHADLGVWWSVIAGLLLIAGTGAFIGTWIHGWSESTEH